MNHTHPKKTLFTSIGTLCLLLSIVTLYSSLLTPSWLLITEPIIDQTELQKLGPHDQEPKPHLLKAKIGLFKTCILVKYESECREIDWKLLLKFEFDESEFGSELVGGVRKGVRLTLPFMLLTCLFTSCALLTLIFGTFCEKNKKIIEAVFLILAGLSHSLALLTFISQIGSEFDSTHYYSKSTTHYRYKYGPSFYGFLLSFSLAELAAFFDMVAFFRGQKKTNEERFDDVEMKLNSPDITFMQHEGFLSPEVVVVSHYGTTGGRGIREKSGDRFLESFATVRRGNDLNRL